MLKTWFKKIKTISKMQNKTRQTRPKASPVRPPLWFGDSRLADSTGSSPVGRLNRRLTCMVDRFNRQVSGWPVQQAVSRLPGWTAGWAGQPGNRRMSRPTGKPPGPPVDPANRETAGWTGGFPVARFNRPTDQPGNRDNRQPDTSGWTDSSRLVGRPDTLYMIWLYLLMPYRYSVKGGFGVPFLGR